MDFFFKPRGIVLVGATPKPKGGLAILWNLKKGFDGAIHLVNPNYREVDGIACHATVAEVPDPVDMAIVFVKNTLVPEIVEKCAERGIRGVIIESAGFAETGPEGRALQERLKKIAADTGIRLWGPNCMGLVDAKRKYVFSFVSPVIWEEGLIDGDVSLVVQSGMLAGGFLMDIMTHGTMGVAKVCSIGNKVDVNECDLLEYLIKDPDTGAVGLYLESIPQGRRFLDLCRSSKKPIVVLKGGKSARGAAAALSHTASMAGDGAVVTGVLAQAGVVEAQDFKQMMDICRSLAMFPRLSPDLQGRTAVLTYSGGAGILSADFLDSLGLSVADLSPETVERLAGVYPDWMPPANPVDLWPAVEKNGQLKVYGTALSAVMDDPNVDAVLVHLFVGGQAMALEMQDLLRSAKKAGKPIFVWLIGARKPARDAQVCLQDMGIPVFRELFRAVECMQAVFRRARLASRAVLPAGNGERAFDTIRTGEVLSGKSGALDEHESKKILAAAGIPTVHEEKVTDLPQALAVAEKMGYPLVAKGLAAGIVHKTEADLIRLNLTDERELSRAYEELVQKVGPRGSVLLQKQLPAGLEIIAGALSDPQFGPCVMVGLGGIYAEVLNDRRFAAAPVSEEAALAMIGDLKNQKLLAGFRNAPPVDRRALAQVIARLSELVWTNGSIGQVDLNPLMLVNGSPVCVDASVVLAENG
ncbi:MAG: acetate--CoA ligase family protein [Thermodesulfobacteriota bacterium]